MLTASNRGDQAKKLVMVTATVAAVVAGAGVLYKRNQLHKRREQRKLLTRLRFDLSVQAIQQETQQILDLMKQVDDQVAHVPLDQVTFANSAQKLIDLDVELMARVTNVTFLGHTSPIKAIRDACTDADQKIENFNVERGMRIDVYKVLKALSQSEEFKTLSTVQARYVTKEVEDFERNGLQLDEAKRKKVQDAKQKMANLGIQFQKNLSEEKIELFFSLEELKGLTSDFIEALEKGPDGKLKVELSYPTVFPILDTCEVASTRKAVESAFNSRCINQNTSILEELVRLRHETAVTLGYETHSAYILAVRMAKNPAAVKKFLSEIDSKLVPLAKKEMDTLLELKKEECDANGWRFDGKINMWDLRYYMDKYVKKYCSIDSQQLREYFPLDHVTEVLLNLYQRLLSLKFTEVTDAHVWHSSVKMYAVHDTRKGKEGNLVGYFYLDLFPRQGKYGHAACFTLEQSATNSSGVHIPPAAAMVANFNAPTKTKPSLLSHSEVVTFFHEFGHVMHCICSEVDIPRFSGTSVERDFVEAPSQMLENWCWQAESLKQLSSHYVTKEPLPDTLIKRVISTKEANTGILSKRQILFATFDQRIHTSPKADTAKLLKELQSEIMMIETTPGTNFAASFGHLAGGYDAQYYGYMWSEVFSMDMFMSRFLKEGLLNEKTGLSYRELILARGGTVDGNVMLKDFLGREPNQKAFLESKGLKA